MRNLNQFILERLKITSDTKIKGRVCPKDKQELSDIIEKELRTNPNNIGDGIVDLNFIDTSQITDMSKLFSKLAYDNDNRVVNIDISGWDVSAVKDMHAMFASTCKYLKTTGDLGKWKLNKLENSSYMFLDCVNLRNIGDISNWKLDNLKKSACMFSGTKRLKTVGDITQWKLPDPNWNVFQFSEIEPQPIKRP